MTLHEILKRLEGVRGHGGQYMAKCPAHGDNHQSLSVSVGKDGRVLLHCHTGCKPEDIVWAMGLTMQDLFAEIKPGEAFPSYDPPKNQGKAQFEREHIYPGGQLKKVIMRKPDGGKYGCWFRQESGKWVKGRNGVTPPLYTVAPLEGVVFVVEGEKDVNTLQSLGFNSASGADGAGPGKWRKEYTEQLRGLHVCVLGDNDQVGRDYAAETCNALHGVAASVRLLDLSKVWPEIPEHGDVTDMVVELGAPRATELIGQLSADAAEWEPTETEAAAPRAAKTAADFKDVDTKFVWYPYLPIGDYSVMMADGGTGKTILCCGIASVLSNGELFPGEGFFRAPQDTLIISAEDTGEVLKKRLKKSGADLSRIRIIDCLDSVGMSISEGYGEFIATIREYKPALVIIDPWHAFLGEKVDISRVNAVRPLLQKLANIAKKCDCAMILVSHVNKRAQGENANNAATGSTDFINAARSAFRVIFDGADEDCRIMVHTKTNYAPYGPSVKYKIDDGGVVWLGFSEITRSTLEAAARKHSTPHETLMGAEKVVGINVGLIEALKKSANPFTPARYSYEEFKAEHGELIFGGQQPKRALDRVAKELLKMGYFLKTGIDVRKGEKHAKGFLIQQINDVEPEQSTISEEPSP